MKLTSFFNYPGTEPDPGEAEPDLLPRWTDRQWDVLISYTETVRFRGGQRVIRAGDLDRALLFVAEGSLEALVPTKRSLQRLPIATGSLIGEVAFFDGQARSVDVMAVTDVELLRLDFDAFMEFAVRQPGLARELLMDLGRLLAFRLRRATIMAGR